jgi:DNA-binding YbaB/EbfC family protein
MAFRGGIQELMKQANRMQTKLERMRESMKDEEIVGQALDGKVKATVNGNRELLRVDFSIDDFEGDVEMLQDTIVAAVNDGMRKADEKIDEETQKITGGLKLPGFF